MRYMGGKARIGQRLSDVMRRSKGSRISYLEPFVGGGNVVYRMAPWFDAVQAGDTHEDLILLWRALQRGWTPPLQLSKMEYDALRDSPASALRGFAGFGLSFGGKWFGGYATARGDDYCGAARRGLLRRSGTVHNVEFRCADYRSWRPGPETLVYADPPYARTTRYAATDHFDTAEFWATMRKWANAGALVFVSEYTAPPDALEVWSADTRASLRRDDNRRTVTERLFKLGGP